MIQRLILLIFALLAGGIACRAQSEGWDEFAEQYLDDVTEAEEGRALYEELLELHRNPQNINTAQREDLLRMPFLSEAQADSIVSKIRQWRGMLSMGELMFIRNLEYRERKYLSLFFYCPDDQEYRPARPRLDSLRTKNSSLTRAYREWDKGLKTELSSTFNVPLYRREGFRAHSREELEKNPNRQYLGNNVATTLRYRSSLNNRLSWGLTAQKDEGEPFADGKNRLYDSYSAYVAGKNRGALRKWVLGDYTTHLGLGLTIGAARTDPMSVISSYRPRQPDFRQHTSTDEALFLRGGAVSLEFGKVSILAFGSWRKHDATLQGDSISTILTDGYHRTSLEMQKRHNVASLQGGASVSVEMGNAKLSLNAVQTHYDTPYRTPTALYRKHYFRGSDFGNYSLDYSLRHGALGFYGEAATSRQGGVAVQHRLHYTPHYRLTLHLLHRYYSTHYLATSAQSYRIGSRIQNEHGILAGATFMPNDYLQFKVYADLAHFPFAVYASANPKNALTTQLQAEYSPYLCSEFLLRYKLATRPDDNALHQPDSRVQHTLKAQYRYIGERATLTSTMDCTLLSQPDKSNSSGWMLSQKAIVKLSNNISIGSAIAAFRTDSYAEALRLYEPSLLYSTGYPSCYYHGWRFSASAQHRIMMLHLALKYSITHYTDRSSIGTGLRQYNGSTLQEILIQLSLRF